MTIADLHNCFASYLPRMQSVAKYHFRHADAERRDEAVQNTVCLVWKYTSALVRNGRNVRPRHVGFGSVVRTSPDQIRPHHPGEGQDLRTPSSTVTVDECKFKPTDLDGLVGKKTSVLDQMVFRLDVPAFLATLKPRQRLLALDLAGNMTTSEAAEKHGVTPGAISQFRSRFKQWYDEFFAQ